MPSQSDETYMLRALELAASGRGLTAPNPMVGAVVVIEGEIAGEGYHRGRGNPHAETVAIAAAGRRARGATLYLNLEPCCHHGMTPPCTGAIIEAGISRVVFSVHDPDPRVRGGGKAALAGAGIEVETGLLAEEAVELNLPYIHRNMSQRPLVVLKLALTLDGGLSAGKDRYMTGEEALDEVHRMRASFEAVAVGSGTIRADDPELDRRRCDRSLPPPVRMVLDSQATLDAGHRWLSRSEKVILYCSKEAPRSRIEALRKAGAVVVELEEAGRGLDLDGWISDIGGRGIGSVLVEGGGRIASSIVESGIADRMVLFHSPLVSGQGGWYVGEPLPGGSTGMALTSVRRLGRDSVSVYDTGEIAGYAKALGQRSG